MEKWARFVLGGTAVVLSAFLLWAWSVRPPAPVPVRTGLAVEEDIYNSVTVPGVIEAADSTAVCPAKTAEVAQVYVSAGEQVRQGQVLCTLGESSPSRGTESFRAVWNAVSGVRAAQTVTAAEANVLRAPVAGMVLVVPQAGELVLEGIPCAQIAASSGMQVRVSAPELYAGELRGGQRANVTVAAASEQVYGARVERIAPVASRAVDWTGMDGETTVEAVLALSGETDALRPGYTASVKVFTDHHAAAVVVPHEAVCQRGEDEFVFCIRSGRAVQCAVQTGYMLEQVTEITNGLAVGEIVVLSPPDDLADGMPVEVTV